MAQYNVSFVFDQAVVSTTITTDDPSEIVGLAQDTIAVEIGFVVPENCSVEIEELD